MRTQKDEKIDMKQLQKKFEKIKEEILKDKQIKNKLEEMK